MAESKNARKNDKPTAAVGLERKGSGLFRAETVAHADGGQIPTAVSTERWVSGKSKQELLADLKVYLARLRDDPRSLQDRLKVAAIQLRLGRIDEAVVHYEGVLRGYVSQGQTMSAIALCQRILGIYPDLPRLKRVLAALYARVPHGAAAGPTPVTPIGEPSQASFVLEPRPSEEVRPDVVVDRLYSPHASASRSRTRDLLASEDLRPSMPHSAPKRQRQATEDAPILLTRRKNGNGAPAAREPEKKKDDVVLLTRPKRRR